MDEWELEVTVSYATGLKKVSTLEQNPYCSVWYVRGDARRITTHKKGGSNPTWDKVVRLPIKHNHLESLYGSVLVEILHESRTRDGRIGTAIIPLIDMKSGEGTIQMYDVDPVGKVGVALMRRKKEPGALTSGGRGIGRGGQLRTPSFVRVSKF